MTLFEIILHFLHCNRIMNHLLCCFIFSLFSPSIYLFVLIKFTQYFQLFEILNTWLLEITDVRQCRITISSLFIITLLALLITRVRSSQMAEMIVIGAYCTLARAMAFIWEDLAWSTFNYSYLLPGSLVFGRARVSVSNRRAEMIDPEAILAVRIFISRWLLRLTRIRYCVNIHNRYRYRHRID